MIDKDLQNRLLSFATTPKSVAMPGHWTLPSSGERAARWVAPLAIDGVVVAGLSLDLYVPFSRQREFEGFRALLLANWSGRRWHMGRLELDPVGEPPHHRNPVWAMKRGVPQSITGCHAHLAEDNVVTDGDELAFSQRRDLPVARAIDTAQTHAQLCALIEVHYRIDGFWLEGEVPWDRAML